MIQQQKIRALAPRRFSPPKAGCCPVCQREMVIDPDDIKIHETTRTVVRGGASSKELTRSELKIFKILARSYPNVVTKEALNDYEHGSTKQPEDRGIKCIDVQLCHIRKKISHLEIKIKNLWGEGYALEIVPLEMYQ